MKTTKRSMPCEACSTAKAVCWNKSRGLGCLRCYERKISCGVARARQKKAVVEVPRRDKGKQRAEPREETTGHLAEVLERIVEGIWELVEEQRGLRMAVEVWMRKEEEKEKEQEEKGSGRT